MTQPPDPALTVRLVNGGAVTVAPHASTMYNQQTAGTQPDVTCGKTDIVRVNGRFGPDGLRNGGSLGTATAVIVVR